MWGGESLMTMTKKQLAVREKDIQHRLIQLAGMDPTDETRTEITTLRNEMGDVEQRMAAFIAAQDDRRAGGNPPQP